MEDAEEIVQDIMVWLWEKQRVSGCRKYLCGVILFKSVKNKCLALIDKNQTKRRFCEHMLATEMRGFEDPDFYIAEELMNQIEKTVSQMPETYRCLCK